MAYVDLTYLKKQLNIEADFTDDDEYIMLLEGAAENVVALYCDYPLSNYEDDNGNLPQALVHAIALWVSTNYAIRESVSQGLSVTPHSFELLMDLYRDYKLANEK